MGSQFPCHPPELRRKVLDLVKAGGSVADVVADLQTSDPSIYSWLRRDRSYRGIVPGLTSVEKAEPIAAKAAEAEVNFGQFDVSTAGVVFGCGCSRCECRAQARERPIPSLPADTYGAPGKIRTCDTRFRSPTSTEQLLACPCAAKLFLLLHAGCLRHRSTLRVPGGYLNLSPGARAIPARRRTPTDGTSPRRARGE